MAFSIALGGSIYRTRWLYHPHRWLNLFAILKSSSGEIYSFSDSSVSASLFGFSGGPDGSYTLSEKTDDDGNYILYGSHIAGGEVSYSVTVDNNDQISLTLTNESTFAPKSLTLERK